MVSLGKKCITWTEACVYMQTGIRGSQKQSPECSMKNFAKFTEKHQWQSPFFKSLFFNRGHPSSSSNLKNKVKLQLY